MAARRCSICSIDYPTGVECCRVCGGPTDYLDGIALGADWEVDVARMLRCVGCDPERERVEAWRLKVALDLGYDVEHAESLAASGGDLHELERLIGLGCPLPTAARII